MGGSIHEPVASSDVMALRVLAEAISPDWSLLKTALRVAAYADGDDALLQDVRSRIAADITQGRYVQARALATLTVAIAEVQEISEAPESSEIAGASTGG